MYVGPPWEMRNITSMHGFQQLEYDQWENEYVMINFTSDGFTWDDGRGFRIEYYIGNISTSCNDGSFLYQLICCHYCEK